MSAISTTIRTLSTALDIPRLLAILALALTLVAIPAFSPDEASAYPRSEGQVYRLCNAAGGELHYEFYYTGSGLIDYYMTCTLPSGNTFVCLAWGASFDCA